MRHPTAIIVVALVSALAALVVAGSRVLDRDREQLYESYARERLQVLEEAARVIQREAREIAEDLELAGTLLTNPGSDRDAEREFRAIATIKREYLMLEARRADGRALRVVAHDAPPDIAARAGAAVAAELDEALRTRGSLARSGPLGAAAEPASWYRVFALWPADSADAIAAVVDVRVVLAQLDVLRDRTSSLFIVGADRRVALRGQPLPAALDGLVGAAHRDGNAVTVLAPGTLDGQPDASVAVATSIRMDERHEPWTLVRVSSAASLRSQERTLARRFVAGGGLALLLLLGFAAYVFYAARRAAVLRELVRHAGSEKLIMAGQLAAGIAHEIGTPLNIARGRAELALSRLGAEHPQSAAQRVIIDQVDLVTRLIRQLLDFVRPSHSGTTTVDAAAVIERVADLLGPQATKRGVTLVVDRQAAPQSVHADPDQLQQILVNLVMNAIDACSAGGRVEVRARPEPGAVVLEVEDDGHGIAPELRSQVFDPFFTTKKRGQGTGLGLWIVAQLVRSHGAEIELADGAGGGTLVRIAWPAAERGAAP